MVKWNLVQKIVDTNELENPLNIRVESHQSQRVVTFHDGFLNTPDRESNEASIRNKVLDLYIKDIDVQMQESLQGNEMRWDHSNEEIRRRDPYCHPNFVYALSRVSKYIACVRRSGAYQIRLRLKYPLIQFATLKYQYRYKLSKRDYEHSKYKLITTNGYKSMEEDSSIANDFTQLHLQHATPPQNQFPNCMRTCSDVSWGEMLCTKIVLHFSFLL